MSVPRIVELAQRIATNTSQVNEYLTVNNLPQPSFSPDGPLYGPVPKDAPPEIIDLNQSVLDDTTELHQLMLGPRDYLMHSFPQDALLPQQAITRFGLARNLPIGGETTFAEMAALSGLSANHIRKLVRYAVSQKIFEELRPGVITHSAASRLLAEDTAVHDYVFCASDEFWQASAQTCNAMAQFPGSEEPTETGFALANKTNKSMYEFLAEYPDRSIRFGNFMRAFTSGSEFDMKHVVDSYSWEQHNGGTIVDVGGSQGFVSAAIARQHPSLSFIVQDLGPAIEGAHKGIPSEVADRVSFMAYNFMEPQPVVGADVYFFRWIFHNWSDKYCVKILKNLIPALKEGSKIVVSDAVLPVPGERPRKLEYEIRWFDTVMTEILNAKEREIGEWEELFRSVDERFHFEGATTLPGAFHSIIVATWKGS